MAGLFSRAVQFYLSSRINSILACKIHLRGLDFQPSKVGFASQNRFEQVELNSPGVCGDIDFSVGAVWPVCRFTPTCVGTSIGRFSWSFFAPVHPHVCGDIMTFNGHFVVVIGSPPRVWGHRHRRFMLHLLPRFTPTCVGTSDFSRFGYGLHDGSPPRVWGHLCCWRYYFRWDSVHPHVCGDIVQISEE